MKNQPIILGVLGIIVVVGIGAVVLRPQPKLSDSMTSTAQPAQVGTATESSYIPYSKAALDGAQGGKRVLFFYAS